MAIDWSSTSMLASSGIFALGCAILKYGPSLPGKEKDGTCPVHGMLSQEVRDTRQDIKDTRQDIKELHKKIDTLTLSLVGKKGGNI